MLRATLEALTDIGVHDLTMNEIARRADVHATSIQRRWGSVEAVLLDALLTYSKDRLQVPDTGNLRSDLVAFSQALAAYLAAPQGDAVVRALVAAPDTPMLAEQRARFWRARLDATRVIIDRAVARGELTEDADPAFLLEQLIAPLHFRHLLTHQRIQTHDITRIVDLLVASASPVR